MLQYKNHRFHHELISFQIPEGFFLDSRPELLANNSIRLYATDESFSLELRVEMDCDSAEQELASVIHDMEPTVIYNVAPLTVNGLRGHYATFRCQRTQYYEAWFDLEEGTAFSIVVETHGDILAVDTAAVVAAIDLSPRSE